MRLDHLRRRLPTWLRLSTYAGLTILLLGVGDNPWQPVPAAAADVIPVRGVERLGWTQDLPGAAAMASYRFVALVDGVQRRLLNARCTGTRNGTQYECEASLPPLSPGGHQIAVMALDPDGYFSAPSESLALDVVPFTVLQTSGERTCLAGGNSESCFAVEVVATGLAGVRNLQWLPDGRALFVEGDSDVRILDGARIGLAYVPDRDPNTEVRVADIAVAADFSRTRHAFMALVREDADGTTRTDIVRARELGGRLGEMLTVIPDLPTAPGTEPALAVGSDGRLYVAMAEARVSSSRPDVYDGRVLRFESDGRSAARPGWPVFATGNSSPAAIEVDAQHRAWLAELNVDAVSPPLSVISSSTSSELSSETTTTRLRLDNWPDEVTGVRALSVGYGRSGGSPTLYIAPSGLTALLLAFQLPSATALTVAQLPLPNIDLTAVAVLPSGVILVGGMERGATGPARATLLRLRPTR
jgi:glucose/sorbosone dehydrogenase